MTILWLIVAVAFFIGELICPLFFMFWLAVAALLALLVSLITTNLSVQVGTFLVFSIIFLIFLKPLTNKLFKNKSKDKVNMDGIIGKKALVIKEIDNITGKGEVKVDGEVWSATSENNEIINEGAKVEILKVNGVKLVVKIIEEEKKD